MEHQQLVSILETSFDAGILVNESGEIVFINSPARDLLGAVDDENLPINKTLAFRDKETNGPLSWNEALKASDGSVAVVLTSNGRKGDARLLSIDGFVLLYIRPIQKQDTLESSLHASQALNNSILDAALDPLFTVNEHGIIQSVNKAATTQFGWTRDEFVGSNIDMIVGGKHSAQHDNYMEHYLKTGETRVMGTKRELPARRKDGSEFIIQLSLVEVKVENGNERLFCGFVHDLTQQKQLLTKIEAERNLNAGIIDASLDPLFQVNETGVIQLVNKAATTQFGWTREEFIGNNISMICGGNHGAKHMQYMERYLKTAEARVMGTKRELPARRKDGSEFIIQLSLVEVPVPDGQERIFCGFVLDLTEQKRHLNEIERRESFTNKIIEGSYDALLVTDKDGNITRVNTTAVRKFEAGSDKLCSLNILSLLSPESASWLKKEMDQYLTVGVAMTTQQEVEAVRPCGDAFPALIGVSELEGPDGEPFFSIYMHDLSDRKRMLKIEAEKSAAEFLLFNMLPEAIAGKLKNDPSHIAEHHSFAAVLFADIVGFTSMSSTMEPHEVVSMLNELFSLFDEVVDKYGLNKIKTIGDCYMVTSVPGVEGDEEEHGRLMCHFGLDMIRALRMYNTSEGRAHKLDLRVGINCGPVVAGVVGTKRFLYDLWGDAVNLASRMESTGIPGRVQCPAHVAELMKDDFEFERRGMVQVKGKGEMETYFLVGRKKEYVKIPEKPKPQRRRVLQDANLVRESIRTFEASLLGMIDGPEYLGRVNDDDNDDSASDGG